MRRSSPRTKALRQRTVSKRKECGDADCKLRSAPVWLFDMDNTLHDASWRVFPLMNREMTAYIERHLGVDRSEANRIRSHFWQRYGATLLGLMHEHGVAAAHFLAETHKFPDLPRMLRADASQRAAIRRLPGRKLVLTNAPRQYALRVLSHLRLKKLFDEVISIEAMHQFHRLRPKPDARMLRHVLQKRGVQPNRCILIEDTLQHIAAARRIGMRGVWFTRYAHRAVRRHRDLPMERTGLHGRPCYVRAKIGTLCQLYSVIPN